MRDYKKFYAVITAGGSGTRMGGDIPKQFIPIEGKAILHRTLELFSQLSFEVEILLVLPVAYIDYWKDYYVRNNLRIKHLIVEGGLSRFHSVRGALNKIPDGAVVAVHDGVRPFCPKGLIEKMMQFEFTEDVAGVIPVLRAYDSMRECIVEEGSRVNIGTQAEKLPTRIVPREKFLMVQTPQVFDSTRLKLAYQRPYSEYFTDDASVAEAAGYDIALVQGDRINIKITTQADLEFVSCLKI